MSDSLGKSGVARRGRVIVSIILFQSLLILWLAIWAMEDYINNQYVRAYVNGTVQSDGWIFGTVGFLALLGSVLGLMMRRRHSATLELVNTGGKIPISTPVARSAKSVTPARSAMPMMKSGSVSTAPTTTTVTATGAVVEGPKPTVELHPAVAALKAELSEARMSLGLASVTTGQAGTIQSTGPAQKFEDQRPPVPAQQLQVVQSQTTPPRPQMPLMGGNVPPTVIRPMMPPGPGGPAPGSPGIRLTPSTVIRPMLPASGPTGPQQNLPVSKVEDRSPMGPARPMGPQPGNEQQPRSQIDVSTIITGIVPDPKKKDGNSQNAQSNQQK